MTKTSQWTSLFFRLKLWILVGIIIGAFSMFILTLYVIPEKYSTSSSLVLTDEISVSEMKSLKAVLENDDSRKDILNKIDNVIDIKEFGMNVIVSVDEGGHTLEFFAQTEDPYLSSSICNAYLHLANTAAENTLSEQHGGKNIIKTKNGAPINEAPTSPDMGLNILIGTVMGLVVSVSLIVLAGLFDDSIVNEKELKNKINASVLGEIPDFFS